MNDGETRTLDFRLSESITTLGAVLTEAKTTEREVFEDRPNLGLTLLSAKVVSSVPRLGESDVLHMGGPVAPELRVTQALVPDELVPRAQSSAHERRRSRTVGDAKRNAEDLSHRLQIMDTAAFRTEAAFHPPALEKSESALGINTGAL